MHRASKLVAATIAGSVLGAAPFADRVARRHGIDDLRRVGDGNPGFWNLRDQVGTRAAMPVFVGDLAKGAAAAALGRLAHPAWWAPSVTGAAAMVGHAFPKAPAGRAGRGGGRSVLTWVGAATVAAPRPAAAAWLTLAGTWAVTETFERSVHVAVVSFPCWQLLIEGRRRTAVTGALMTFVGWRLALLEPPPATTAAPDR